MDPSAFLLVFLILCLGGVAFNAGHLNNEKPSAVLLGVLGALLGPRTAVAAIL